MASKQSNVDYVVSQMSEAGDVTARKMFGEFGIYRGAKIFALYCDDQLFIKPTDPGRAFIAQRTTVKEGPPYPGAKPYFVVTGDLCEDGEWLSELARVTSDALPAPAPKTTKAAKAKRAAKAPPTTKTKPAAKAKLTSKTRPAAKKRAAKNGRSKRR